MFVISHCAQEWTVWAAPWYIFRPLSSVEPCPWPAQSRSSWRTRALDFSLQTMAQRMSSSTSGTAKVSHVWKSVWQWPMTLSGTTARRRCKPRTAGWSAETEEMARQIALTDTRCTEKSLMLACVGLAHESSMFSLLVILLYWSGKLTMLHSAPRRARDRRQRDLHLLHLLALAWARFLNYTPFQLIEMANKIMHCSISQYT